MKVIGKTISISAFLLLLLPAFSQAGGFRPLAPMDTPRLDPAVVRLSDGRVLVAGGHTGPEGATRRAEIYNPRGFLWESTGRMQERRTGASASLLPDGKVLVSGGKPARESFWAPLRSAEIFDPETGRFSTLSSKPLPRAYGESALIGSEVLIWGGQDENGFEPTSQIFNPQTGAFRQAGLPSPRLWGGETNLFSSRFAFRIGGYRQGRTSASVVRYARGWSPLPALLRARAEAAGVVLPGGDLLVAGGWSGKSLRSVERFSGGAWRRAPRLRQPRLGADLVLLAGKPTLLSGWIGGKSTDRTEVLRSGKWRVGPRMFYPRWGASSASLGNGQVLLIGGVGRRGPVRSAEVFDPHIRAPWVDIKSAPRKTTKKRNASFVLKTEGRARIECRLDRNSWRRCSKTPLFRVRPGKHIFQARSRVWKLQSPPAVWRWTVRR